MNKVKLFKPAGKEIMVNDVDDAIAIMIRDGWRLDPIEEPKPKRKTTRRKKDEQV